jgi:hypothetical protein
MENKIKNISRFDYILWDKLNNKPLEDLDIVYHYTSVVELINDGFKLNESEEFICVAELPISWQEKINIAIEKNK